MINLSVAEKHSFSASFYKKAMDFFRHVDRILGIIGLPGDKDIESGPLEAEIEALILSRDNARKNRDFTKSDQIRDELASRGIILEDTPRGTRWKK